MRLIGSHYTPNSQLIGSLGGALLSGLRKTAIVLQLVLVCSCIPVVVANAQSGDTIGDQKIDDTGTNTPLPILTVTAERATITEGETAEFTFSVGTVPLLASLTAHFALNIEGNFLNVTTNPREFEIGKGRTSETFGLETVDDMDYEAYGFIELIINTNKPGYRTDTTLVNGVRTDIAKVNVMDNDAPEVLIGRTKSSVVEGNPARFAISSKVVLDTDRTIGISVSVVGEFLKFEEPDEFVLEGGKDVDYLELETVDDDSFEREGSVTVSLQNGPDASVGQPPHDKATVTIIDNDNQVPAIFVAASYNEITEGGEAKFVFGSETIAPASTIMINFSVHVTGDYLSENSSLSEGNNPTNQIELEAGKFINTLSIATVDDDQEEQGGVIRVTVRPGVGYEPLKAKDIPNEFAVVELFDNDAIPSFSIEVQPFHIVQNGVIEGNRAKFFIISDILPQKNIALQLNVTQRKNYLVGGSGIREFEVDPRNRYYGDRNFWLLTIATINDGYTQGDGEITVSIIRGLRAEYKVGQPSTASLTVLDNDPPICMHPFPCVPVPPVPIISVERMADSIVEGEVAKFTISAEYPFSKATHPRSDLTILIRVIVVGDITLWPNQANVMLSGDKTEVLLKIPTKIGLGENMNHGSIQVRLIEDAWNYAASSTKNDPTIRVEKLVDDQDSNSPLYSVANLALMKIVSNGTVGLPTAAQGEPAIPNMQMGETEQSLVAGGKPSISIEAERNEVVEGETARFKIHASPPFDEQSAVYYTLLTDTANTNEHAQTQVTFQPGQSTVLLELNTNNGELLENNGQLLVQLLPGPGYALDDTSNTTATINVANRIDRHNQQSESNSASRFALSQMFGEATFKPINEVGNRVANSLNGQLEVGSTHNPANVVPQLIRNGGILANDGYRGWSELLGTTNFAVPLATVESSLTDITFWGRGIRNSFQGELAEADVHWFGNNSTSIFGTDALIEDTSIVGMSASISDLRSKFSMTNHEEKYLQFSSMGVYPYFGWISKDRNSELRLVSGVGKGVTKAGQTASELEHSNSVSYAFSLEGSDRLYSNDKEFGSGQAVVSVNGRIQFSRHQLSVTSSGHKFTDIHSRVTNIWLEGNNNLALTEFATINPTISLGYLENRNDRGTVRCMSLQSGATYETVSGLHLSINGGTLVPCDNGFRATSLSGSIEYVEHGTGEGMQFSISPSMVDSHTDENNGLNSIVVDYLDDFNRANRTENQIETELKYGFGISDGTMLLTPHVSFEMSDEGNSILGIGSKVTSDSKFEFGVQLNRTSSYRNDIDTELALNGIVRW